MDPSERGKKMPVAQFRVFHTEYSIRNTAQLQEKKTRGAKPDLRAIGLRIRSLRAEMKQVEFASELGISQAQLSKIERGEVAPTLELLVRLSSKFKKTVDWIVNGNS